MSNERGHCPDILRWGVVGQRKWGITILMHILDISDSEAAPKETPSATQQRWNIRQICKETSLLQQFNVSITPNEQAEDCTKLYIPRYANHKPLIAYDCKERTANALATYSKSGRVLK